MRIRIIIPILLLIIAGLVSCKSNDDLNSSNISANDISSSEKIPTLNLREVDEEGDLLTIQFKILDEESNKPISDVEIFLYHADENGDYLPAIPGDETTAKYSGKIRTNAEGECLLETIVPRKYETNGNQHIHLHSITAKGYQIKGGVILFDHDVNDEVRQWATDTGFGFIIKLEDTGNEKVGELVIKLNKEKE